MARSEGDVGELVQTWQSVRIGKSTIPAERGRPLGIAQEEIEGGDTGGMGRDMFLAAPSALHAKGVGCFLGSSGCVLRTNQRWLAYHFQRKLATAL